VGYFKAKLAVVVVGTIVAGKIKGAFFEGFFKHLIHVFFILVHHVEVDRIEYPEALAILFEEADTLENFYMLGDSRLGDAKLLRYIGNAEDLVHIGGEHSDNFQSLLFTQGL
jgi:hypothetical protein